MSPRDEVKLNQVKARAERKKQDLKKDGSAVSLRQLENIEQADVNAKLLEKVLPIMIEANQWFGEYTTVTKSHEYDDWLNATDLIVTFAGTDEPAHLAVDVTVADDQKVLQDKLDKIKREIAIALKLLTLPNMLFTE